MITLLIASAINLTALQASIAAPTNAFRTCLREAAAKAKTEKVAGDAIEAYLKTACSRQMSTLKGAIVAFRTKNGMSNKQAADDANMTVEDYVATPVDNYKFMANMEQPEASTPPAPSAAPVAIPAAAPTQPPKP